MYTIDLEPGEVYTKMLPISQRLPFSGSGVYTVTGERAFKLGKTFEEARNLGAYPNNRVVKQKN